MLSKVTKELYNLIKAQCSSSSEKFLVPTHGLDPTPRHIPSKLPKGDIKKKTLP